MKEEIANILREELRFDNISYSSFKSFKEEITKIYEKLKVKYGDKTEFTLKEKISIKKQIKEYLSEIYINLESNLSIEIEEQFKILEEKEKVSPIILLAVFFQGLNFSDMLLKQQNYHLDRLFKMINNNEIDKGIFISKGVLEQLNTIAYTISKQGREEIRNKKSDKEIIGWKSIAILDGKTSSICLSKHNQFYSKERYETRQNIPDLPPRHYNCRSLIVDVYSKDDFKDERYDLNTFFKENKEDALDILGKNRFELFNQGKLDFKSFLDLKGGKLYTIKEIRERLL